MTTTLKLHELLKFLQGIEERHGGDLPVFIMRDGVRFPCPDVAVFLRAPEQHVCIGEDPR